MEKSSHKKRRKRQPTEYEITRRRFRAESPRHVLEVDADVPENLRRKILGIAEKLRKITNESCRTINGRIDQLFRRKRFRNARKEYALAKKANDRERLIAARNTLVTMQTDFGVTKEACVAVVNERNKKYGLSSVVILSRAEDIWGAVETVLFGDGKYLHFKKRRNLPALRGKQYNKEIILKRDKIGNLHVFYQGDEIPIRAETLDEFQTAELEKISEFLESPSTHEASAVYLWNNGNGRMTDTFRPCFVALAPKMVRGKSRLYIQIIVEGRALPKARHRNKPLAKEGTCGLDIGPQSAAWTTDSECGLINLGERGPSIDKMEKKLARLLRKLDRRRRAANPDNYYEDGRIKPRRERKPWVKTNNYRRTLRQIRSLYWRLARNHEYANNETANHLRRLAKHVVTEPPNFKSLQKKTKKPKDGSVKLDKNGRPARRKRHGLSLWRRCPGYFQARVKYKFESTGGTYTEVPKYDYRASQYDHTNGEYIKKGRNVRIYKLSDGTKVQRDLYSSFLLYMYDAATQNVDKADCRESFVRIYPMHQARVQYIKEHNLKIMNSGIRGN